MVGIVCFCVNIGISVKFYVNNGHNSQIWRLIEMENEIWERIAQFLNRLRGERLSGTSSVQMPELTEKQKQTEKLAAECREVLNNIPESGRQLFIKWQKQVAKENGK